MSNDTIIKLDRLCYGYSPDKQVLTNISLEISKGEAVGIIGESGCGKTTLCNCMCGIIPHIIKGEMTGTVIVNGIDVKETKITVLSKHIGTIFQDADNQMVTTTVEDEIAFAPENLCVDPVKIREIVDETMEMLGITELRHKNPALLSGGQKQLVAIAAVLALDPEIIIMDEPMSNLDRESRERINNLMLLLKSIGKTLIIVEHNYENIDFADRWIVLKKGHIETIGTPSEVMEGDYLDGNRY